MFCSWLDAVNVVDSSNQRTPILPAAIPDVSVAVSPRKILALVCSREEVGRVPLFNCDHIDNFFIIVYCSYHGVSFF